MNKILLIDRLNPKDESDEKQEVFFMLGGMNDPIEENRIMDILNSSELISSDDILLKYNGIELNIRIKDIPTIVKLLVENNISIYGIYKIYSPYDDLL